MQTHIDPQPETTDFPLGLPYNVFRYTDVYQSDGGYFVPDDIEYHYEYMRKLGCSKSVAWDLTRAMVERQISDLFGTPLTYCYVRVVIEHNGVELGSAGIGTTYLGGDDYPLECADECGLVDEALDAARETVEILKAVTV